MITAASMYRCSGKPKHLAVGCGQASVRDN